MDYTTPDYIPNAAAYANFLSTGKITELERSILLANFAAPLHCARNAAIAAALSSTMLIVNGAYGRLGNKAIRALFINLPDRAQASHAFAWFERLDDGYWYSTMHVAVCAAIRSVGWADEANSIFGAFWKSYVDGRPRQTFWEGRQREESFVRRARNGTARLTCIEHWGCKCYACEFSFEVAYGDLGAEFIEVHHLQMIANREDEEHEIDPILDLKPVCSNCHRMLHRDGLLDVEVLKAKIINRIRK